MKRPSLLTTLAIIVMAVQCGCGPKKPEMAGFLSDYSKLEAQSDVSYRYLAPGNPLGRYSKFIIDPVEIYFHEKSKAKGKIKEEDLTDLKNYMHSALVKGIEDRYGIVYRPGSGVARVRVAITDLKKSRIIQNIVPIGKVAGTGIGGASLEAELVDSQTGEQIGALVESQLGKRLSLDGYSTWGDAKGVMDRWAKRFRERLDEAHAR
ncbi:MAG: DUF3313 domain-containing protein [Planctomycetota bacterium]|jgi:hypothetical protein